MGKSGSFPSSPRQRRGGGRGARLGGVARGGVLRRGGEWGQGVVGVPRVAVEQHEVAYGPPWRRAAPLCAGGRAKQRGREVEDEGWTFLQFLKSLGVLL